eukprot:4515292-Amphidinium_carterae.1
MAALALMELAFRTVMPHSTVGAGHPKKDLEQGPNLKQGLCQSPQSGSGEWVFIASSFTHTHAHAHARTYAHTNIHTE